MTSPSRAGAWTAVGVLVVAAAGCGGGGAPAGHEASPPPSTTAPSTQPMAPSPVPHESCTEEVVAPIQAVGWHDMKWKGNGGRGEGNDPHVVLALAEAGAVCGVRLRFTVTTTDGKPAFFQVFWRMRGGAFGEKDQQSAAVPSSAKEQTFTAWIDGTIDAIRVDPDIRPVDFKLSGITLLKPAGPAR